MSPQTRLAILLAVFAFCAGTATVALCQIAYWLREVVKWLKKIHDNMDTF